MQVQQNISFGYKGDKLVLNEAAKIIQKNSKIILQTVISDYVQPKGVETPMLTAKLGCAIRNLANHVTDNREKRILTSAGNKIFKAAWSDIIPRKTLIPQGKHYLDNLNTNLKKIGRILENKDY